MLAKDYTLLAKQGVSAERLANIFLEDYFNGEIIDFPINPFQILTNLGVPFIFRPFKSYDGIYIPRADQNDIPVVGINLNRPIARQRFSAAHELCHHIKDAHSGFICKPNAQSEIEQYAESFASELLMPTDALRNQVGLYAQHGYIDLDGVLRVADYFGVSFKACLNKIAYRLHMIEGDTSPKELEKRARKFKPQLKRKELGLYETKLYEQIFDAIGDNFHIVPTERACQKYKAEYIFHDSRMEGVDIDIETVGDIVEDLRRNKQDSVYCKEENQNIIEVAGLTLAYDYAFEEAETNISVYDAKHINEKLYSTAPFPEFGGLYRQSNTLVLGAKFETIDFRDIPNEMRSLDKDIEKLMDQFNSLPYSQYIEEIIKIHHRLTVIHAFRDGNGRTSRAFANMMLLKRHISPVFFDEKSKSIYKEALKTVDLTGDYNPLFEVFFRAVLAAYAALSDFNA